MKQWMKMADQSQVYVEDIGEGFPILFLHGNNKNSRYFKRQKELSKEFRLIFIDSRGHGYSIRNRRRPLTFPQLANDIETVLDNLSISSCLIVGHSDGGNVALTYVQTYPDRVAGLLLNGSNFRFFGLGSLVKLGVKIEIALLKFLAQFSSYFKDKLAVATLLAEDVSVNRDRLNSFCKPTLVLVGEKDMIDYSHSQEMANFFLRVS
ncbi:alpha/beta hydrolase [Streptococcus didelphis]|uniref:Alpha/beta hydrolase n=1 Tax=Streptococcus didelphis TaxID=102886 RepID=A0ABY9LJ76_9STRE|nr:alpha/beta hydrolase [Streptococcus didelphis]WMB28181.1 alpha/beta hydrolase [Streptococcus didelphis]